MADYRQFSTVAPTTPEFDSLAEFREATTRYCDWKEAGQQGPVPRTFLGILVDEDRRLVVRGSRRVEFGGHEIPWRLFLLMWRRTTAYSGTGELIRAGWTDLADTAIDVNVHYHVSVLRRLIKPLGLAVANKRDIGYRLERIS